MRAQVVPATCKGIGRVTSALRGGELCIIPTDTVYGLAALIEAEPVSRLFLAKGRPVARAIPVLVLSLAVAESLSSDWSSAAQTLAEAFWPGPLTIVVPADKGLPRELTAGLGTVGLRLPDSSITQEVLRGCGGALAVTSANQSGEHSARTVDEAVRALPAASMALDGGALEAQSPSTVVELVDSEPRVLRGGPISLTSLQQALAVGRRAALPAEV